MRDAKRAVLEDQLDTLAGRLADAEERFERLLKVLTTGEVPRKLGLKGAAWEAAQEDEDDDSDADGDRTPAASRPDPTVWDKALAHLATVVNRYSFVTWFEETSLVRDDGKTLIVRTRDRMAAAWLEKEYTEVVNAALAAVGRPEASVKFVEGDDEESDS